MCGRISCHLCGPDYRKAASYLDPSKGHFVQPDWIDGDGGSTYAPSTNLAPTDVLPVLLSRDHEQNHDQLSKYIIKPMIWGMIPPWHKGDSKSHGLTTNNCRIEGLLQSRLYCKPLRNGQRCVIGCQGFYEWQTTKGKDQPKQPYFIKASNHNSKVGQAEDLDSWTNGTWDETSGWVGPKLLMMAGLFDVWTSPEGKELFSFTVITMESNKTFGWLHHRIPAILDSEEQMNNWLDHSTIPDEAALKLLQPTESIVWHPVSTLVNNARNKDVKCNKPVDLKKPKPANKIMEAWLKRAAPSNNDQPSKKAKGE